VSPGNASVLVGLVAAAGTGSRYAAQAGTANTPKQYLPLAGIPVIVRSINALSAVAGLRTIVLVLHPEDQHWKEIASAMDAEQVDLHTVAGGGTRAESVAAGLDFLSRLQELGDLPIDAAVLVHDAARPLVRPTTIQRLIDEVARQQVCGGILATPVSDTLKLTTHDNSIEKTLDRSCVWQAQTPQLFSLQPLRAALLSASAAGIVLTDEASALEFVGESPIVVRGDEDNIKLTHAQDLPLAELLLES